LALAVHRRAPAPYGEQHPTLYIVPAAKAHAHKAYIHVVLQRYIAVCIDG